MRGVKAKSCKVMKMDEFGVKTWAHGIGKAHWGDGNIRTKFPIKWVKVCVCGGNYQAPNKEGRLHRFGS